MSQPAPSLSDEPPDITDVIVNLVLSFLAPMFLVAAGGNINLARIAAAHTLESHEAEAPSDLISIAQIIAFGLAALGSLSLSMTDGLSVSMILRLRGNAKSSSRAAEQIRHALRRHRHDWEPPVNESDAKPNQEQIIAAVTDLQKRAAAALAETTHATAAAPIPMPAPAAQPPAAPPATTPAPSVAPTPAPSTAPSAAPSTTKSNDRQNHVLWANAFADVAAEIAAEMPGLPPLERRAASIRAAALNTSATALLSGNLDPRLNPGDRLRG